jgi:nicotinamide mononucleotide transporter
MEIIATATTLLCVYWSVNKNIWSWVASIAGALAYMFIFIEQNMWSQTGLQLVFLIQSVYGWYNWSKNTHDNKLKIETLRDQSLAWSVVHVFSIIALWSICLFISLYTKSNLPYLDSILTTLSITATYYMARRILESWVFWIFVDISYVLMFLYLGLYLSACLYFILLLLAIKGFIEWRRL